MLNTDSLPPAGQVVAGMLAILGVAVYARVGGPLVLAGGAVIAIALAAYRHLAAGSHPASLTPR